MAWQHTEENRNLDASRRLVKTILSKNKEEVIDPRFLPAGNDVLKIFTDKEIFNKKFMKK